MRVTNCAGERSFSRLKLMEKKSASQRKNEAAAFELAFTRPTKSVFKH
jgi:hypothetical protein